MTKNDKVKISAIIIAKNDEEKIEDCLKSIVWCDEIILIDSGSVDSTTEIAKKYKAKVYRYEGGSFNNWRNAGLKHARNEWIFYIDTDERVPKELKDEISGLITNISARASNITNVNISVNENTVVFAVPRKNFILGREMKHGGWWPDYVKRVFKKNALKKWVGDLHEEPVYVGALCHLKNPLIHIKEDNLSDMVEKTNHRSEIEARLMFDAGHPVMNIPRFFSAAFREFWYRFVVKKAFLDGAEGIIFGIYQVYSRFISYAKLWEMQNNNIAKVKNKNEFSIKGA